MDTGKRWWNPDKTDLDDEAHRAALLENETSSIEQAQSAWYELNLWNATLLTNRELIGFRWGAESESELWPTNLRTENIIESIGEAMLSKASSSPLKPALVPHSNSWKTWKAVRLLDDFMFGVWRMTDAEDAAVQMFRDAYTAGLGCVRIAYDAKKGTLHAERVFFDNIVIDNRECANGASPRTYRIRQVLPRSVVESRYGKDFTDEAVRKQREYAQYREVGDGYVVLIEAWRLPDADGEGGYHMLSCCGQIISEEKWTHDWVPLVFFHWQDRISGFFCKGGVEQLVPYQIRQNELNDDIQHAQDISCRMRLLAHAGTQIHHDQWDSEHARILYYTGEAPVDFKWSSNLTELYQERVSNRAAAYSFMGISESFANADMPQQVRYDSSAAIREGRNMEDSRHLRLWTRFEKARMDIARTMLRVLANSKGAEAYNAVYHPAKSNAAMRMIPFEAVQDLEDDIYGWTLEPMSVHQMTPAARRETMRDNTSRGLVVAGAEEARRMYGNVDLELIEDLELADQEDIYRHIELLEEEDYEEPTELTALPIGVKLVNRNMKRLLRFDDIKPEDTMIQLHIKWLVTAQAKMQAMTAQPAEPPPPQVPFAPTQGMPGTSAATAPPTYQPMINLPQMGMMGGFA